MTPEVSIIVPVYNEAPVLDELVRRCAAVGAELGRRWELILVDDGSADRSAEAIETAVAAHAPHVTGVLLSRNFGQHPAIMAGFEQARGDVCVTLDADLQNPPEEIPRLLEKIDEGYDVVGSVRRDRKDSLLRTLPSQLVNFTIRRSTGVAIGDFGCMLRAYRRPVVDAILRAPERSTFLPVVALSFARSATEIEVSHAERTAGDSSYGPWKLINYLLDLVTCLTTFPFRMLSIAGLLIAAGAVGFGLVLAVAAVFGAGWAGGTAALFAVLFVLVGLQFSAMGLIGEYLGRVYDDVRARPRFVVARVVRDGGVVDEPPVPMVEVAGAAGLAPMPRATR